MFGRMIGALGLVGALWGAMAQAEAPRPVVVELYTSQGCSSCPPADALLAELADTPGIIALSFHVDYWDYIGWTDTFAAPAHGRRQKTYATHFRERMVYTPQMIIQGQQATVGHKRETVNQMIQAARAAAPQADLTLIRDGTLLQIALAPQGAPAGPGELHLVRFQPEAMVQIGSGENAGRRASYRNVVREWHLVGMWDGQAPTQLTVPLPGDLPVAVLLHGKGQGGILAAATLP